MSDSTDFLLPRLLLRSPPLGSRCSATHPPHRRCESGDEACTDLCGWISYTYTVDCLNCLVSFGTPGVNATKANDMLEQISDLCEDAGKKVLSTGLVTAKPTTT